MSDEPKSTDLRALSGAVRTLAAIADAYDRNELDDEARKWWGYSESPLFNKIDPAKIELYTGRGGGTLLTLKDCLDARDALREIEAIVQISITKGVESADKVAKTKKDLTARVEDIDRPIKQVGDAIAAALIMVADGHWRDKTGKTLFRDPVVTSLDNALLALIKMRADHMGYDNPDAEEKKS